MEKERAELFLDWIESIHHELTWGCCMSKFPDINLEWTKSNQIHCTFRDGSSVQIMDVML
jgi:hypothetical protein